jgi:hypothetical protein
MVSALCDGKRDWIMSIPARPDHDPDLVIGEALRVADDLYDALKAVVGSDMAMREEDEGNVSKCLELARAELAKARGEV